MGARPDEPVRLGEYNQHDVQVGRYDIGQMYADIASLKRQLADVQRMLHDLTTDHRSQK